MMADQESNMLTLESLKFFLVDLTDLRDIDKMTELILNVIGEGYPINFFKFAHFHWRYKTKEIDLLFNLVDISKDGNIGVYEIE